MPTMTPMATALPGYATLLANYPAIADSEKVKKDIGGKLTDPIVTNTCIVRMSKAFNYAGQPQWELPETSAAFYTLKGADKKNYGLRIEEFSKHLASKYQAPDVSKSGAAISVDAFKGKKGIIGWHINGWNDARGHFTLWDGAKGVYVADNADYFKLPISKPADGRWLQSVELWIC